MLQKIFSGGTLPIVPLFLSLALIVLRTAESRALLQFASGVNLVEVYATVTDSKGEPATGLRAADFEVTEDGVPQTITTFAAGEFRLSVVIALDRSFSMAGERLALAKQAARTFIAALRPEDEVTVVAIGSEIQTITPPVPASAAAATRWDAIDAWGTTPLYDVIVKALAIPDAAERRRRALLVISDGNDRDSQTTASELLDRARRTAILVYPIAIGQTRQPVFAELAAVTGGRSFAVKDPRELSPTLNTVARELRFQYLLGYTPSRPSSEEPEWHALDVSVNRPGVRVRARDGYFSR